jgi:hypothetical protein
VAAAGVVVQGADVRVRGEPLDRQLRQDRARGRHLQGTGQPTVSSRVTTCQVPMKALPLQLADPNPERNPKYTLSFEFVAFAYPKVNQEVALIFVLFVPMRTETGARAAPPRCRLRSGSRGSSRCWWSASPPPARISCAASSPTRSWPPTSSTRGSCCSR